MPAAPHGKLSRGRSIGIWSLIVLASVIGLITILTVWVNRQLLNNDQFRKASAQLIQDPQIRDAVSVYVVDQLYNNVDVSGQLEKQLPNNLKPLAGPVAAGLRQPAVAGGQLPAQQAARPGGLRQRDGDRAPEARQRAREQDRLRDHTGNGVVTVDLSSAREGARHRSRAPGGRAGQDPAEHRRVHRHEVGPARRGAEGRARDQGAERLADRPRARPLRPRHLPRPRAPARDASEHRLGLRPRRPDRARRPPRHGQLRGRRASSSRRTGPPVHTSG